MKLKYLLRGIGIGVFTAGLVAFLVTLGGGKMSDEKVIERARELGYEKEEDILARINGNDVVKLTEETPINATETSEKEKAVVEEILPGGVKTSEENTSEENTEQVSSEKTSEDTEAAKKAEEEATKKAEEEAAKKAEEEAAKKAEEEAKKKAEEEEAKKKAEEEAKKKAEEEEAKKKAEEEAKKKAEEEEAKKKAEEEAKKKAEEELAKKQANGETVTITVKSGQFSETVAKMCKDAGLVADAGKFDKYLCDNGYSGRISVGDHVIAKGASEEEIAKALCK